MESTSSEDSFYEEVEGGVTTSVEGIQEDLLVTGGAYEGLYKNGTYRAYYSGRGVFRVFLVGRAVFMTALADEFVALKHLDKDDVEKLSRDQVIGKYLMA